MFYLLNLFSCLEACNKKLRFTVMFKVYIIILLYYVEKEKNKQNSYVDAKL